MKRYRMLKRKAMTLKGNKCSKCGVKYNGKNAAMFEFHHNNPSEKEYQVTHMFVNKAWEKVLKELEKCSLLCCNCHNLEHSQEF